MLLQMCGVCGAPTGNRPAICDRCAAKRAEAKREAVRYYDRHLRDRRAAEFYRSGAWRKARADYLRSIGWLCEDCMDEVRAGVRPMARVNVATDVHHVVPLAVDWERRLDRTNFRGLCDGHHKGKRSDSARGRAGEKVRDCVVQDRAGCLLQKKLPDEDFGG